MFPPSLLPCLPLSLNQSDNQDIYNVTGRESIQHGYTGEMDGSLPGCHGVGRCEVSSHYSECPQNLTLMNCLCLEFSISYFQTVVN